MLEQGDSTGATAIALDSALLPLVEYLSRHSHPNYTATLTEEDKGTIAQSVVNVLKNGFHAGTIGNHDELVEECLRYFEYRQGSLFTESSREKKTDPECRAIRRQHYYDRFANSQSVNLELGTHKGVPQETVDRIIRAEKLADFICSDFDPQWKPDVVADATELPFLSESIDRIASKRALIILHRKRSLSISLIQSVASGNFIVSCGPAAY